MDWYPLGIRARWHEPKRNAAIGNAENESFGIELGYAYGHSPIIRNEPGAKIPSDPLRYLPTIVPGVRMPSIVMGDGTPIFDPLWDPSEALVAAVARFRS
jgi:hypothetical protein